MCTAVPKSALSGPACAIYIKEHTLKHWDDKVTAECIACGNMKTQKVYKHKFIRFQKQMSISNIR